MAVLCHRCDEPLENSREEQDGFHWECLARMAIGSLAHVEKRCSCYVPGSTEGDDPAMTKRAAARAAVYAYWRTEQAVEREYEPSDLAHVPSQLRPEIA